MKQATARILIACLLLMFEPMFTSANIKAAEPMPPKSPNIIVILADDLGYGDIAPFGCEKAKTPALDRMAGEGLKLTSFYAAPVCSASRAQILTGC